MPTKVLITGGSGQVGQALRGLAPAGVQVLAPARSQLDLTATDELPDRLAALGPAAIINAAAYTAVDQAETEQNEARTINAIAAGRLAEWSAAADIPFVQLSTDFVFSGEQRTPYRPDDACVPVSTYGRTKLEGEQRVRTANPSAWIVRSSWIYSEHGHNFVKTMLRLADRNDTLRVVDDQTGSPTYARHLAAMLWQLLDAQPETRTCHYCDGGATTWYEFAGTIFAEARQMGIIATAPDIVPVSTREYGAPAPRPPYSVLDAAASLSIPGVTQADWRVGLRAMLAHLKSG